MNNRDRRFVREGLDLSFIPKTSSSWSSLLWILHPYDTFLLLLLVARFFVSGPKPHFHLFPFYIVRSSLSQEHLRRTSTHTTMASASLAQAGLRFLHPLSSACLRMSCCLIHFWWTSVYSHNVANISSEEPATFKHLQSCSSEEHHGFERNPKQITWATIWALNISLKGDHLRKEIENIWGTCWF